MKFDDDGLPLETCSNCESARVRFDQKFGFYKCETCGTVWAYDDDDPDYYQMEDGSNGKYAYYGADITPDEPD